MAAQMYTLKKLAETTGKSERTIRRVVKKNENIRSAMREGRIVASMADVLNHF